MKYYLLIALLSLAAPAQAAPRIVGGQDASPTAYSATVALVTKAKSNYQGQFCGGSLIAPDWILTAAHCIAAETVDSFEVLTGVYDLKHDVGQRFAVKRLITHPRYNSTLNDFDIALVQLKTPVENITPLMLDKNKANALTGKMATVVGWGNMSIDFVFSPYHLQQVQLPIISNRQCKEVNAQTRGWAHLTITDNMLCAGDLSGGKDSCYGDSGGPLLIEKNSQLYLAGLVSFGTGCALPLTYGVYTRVANFADFIDEKIHIDYFALADLNQDGVVNYQDKTLKHNEIQSLLRDYLDKCWLTADMSCGDVNHDQKIDWRDLSDKTARLELRYNDWLTKLWQPEQIQPTTQTPQ